MNTVKANFQVDKKDWERFKKITKINESTASQEIRKFMYDYLSKNSQLATRI